MTLDLSPYLLQWLTLVVCFSVAVISPGPDFVVAVRNSVTYSRRAGIMTAIGFGLGVMVHATYTLLGFAVVIAQSIILFSTIKWIGAAYLIYLGYKALQSKGIGQKVVDEAVSGVASHKGRPFMSDAEAVRSGFLTNALNPKAALFFLAIFGQIIQPDTPIYWQIIYAMTCGLMVSAWFVLVAYMLNVGHFRQRFVKAAKWIDRICGGLLIALGIKVAFSAR